jgi:hypothetical protein
VRRPGGKVLRVKRAKVGHCPAYISISPSDNPDMTRIEVFNFHSHSHVELLASRRPSAMAREFVHWRLQRDATAESIVRQAGEAMRGTNDDDLITTAYVSEQGTVISCQIQVLFGRARLCRRSLWVMISPPLPFAQHAKSLSVAQRGKRWSHFAEVSMYSASSTAKTPKRNSLGNHMTTRSIFRLAPTSTGPSRALVVARLGA